MHPDLSAELRDLQRQAEHLSQVARALAAATPVRSEGDDSTGCARVIVDPEGLPLEIRIVNHWQRLHDAESLSAAVLAAHREAVKSAVVGWPGRSPQQGMPDAPVPPRGHDVEITELAERAITALQQVQRRQASELDTPAGTDDGQHVTIQLGAGGLIACTIDAQWATGREGTVISAALAAALRQATASHKAAAAPRSEFDDLLGDALATFAVITEQALDEGEDK